MRVVNKRLGLESRSFRYTIYLSYLHIKIHNEITTESLRISA